ncbi:MAG: hypothetical protein ABEK50_14940 [bacterium]
MSDRNDSKKSGVVSSGGYSARGGATSLGRQQNKKVIQRINERSRQSRSLTGFPE